MEMSGDRAMTARQFPRWSELRPLLRLRPIEPDGDRRRASRAASVADLRRAARRRTPRAVFDYVDGGAEAELSLARLRRAYSRLEFRPNVLRDVAQIDISSSILGRSAAMPVVLGPTGFTRMMHSSGEPAVARAASAAGLPYALSTMGTTSIEDVASAAPRARRWFQLYLCRDRAFNIDLLARAKASGYEALVLTVDTPVAGARLRDVRNGMTIPPTLKMSTFLDGMVRPWWWIDLLTKPPLEFASLSSFQGTVADLANRLFDPSVTMSDLAWLRSNWDGKLVIKGVQRVEDAVDAVSHGVDAVALSNHGGRQLDRSPVPLELLPDVRAAVGDRAEVFVDGGIMSGADVVAAVALGADAVMVGRAYLYGLMAAGETGVRRVNGLFAEEMARTMQLLGVSSVKELTPDLVRLR